MRWPLAARTHSQPNTMDESWGRLFWSRFVWIDLVGVGALALIHLMAWHEASSEGTEVGENAEHRAGAAASFRSTSTGGITAVGILLPLSLVPIQLAQTRPSGPPAGAVFDIFVADLWLGASLLLGLWVLWLVAMRAHATNVLSSRSIGVAYGWQLFTFAAGLARFLTATYSLLRAA